QFHHTATVPAVLLARWSSGPMKLLVVGHIARHLAIPIGNACRYAQGQKRTAKRDRVTTRFASVQAETTPHVVSAVQERTTTNGDATTRRAEANLRLCASRCRLSARPGLLKHYEPA